MYPKQSRAWKTVEFGGHCFVDLLCSRCDNKELCKGRIPAEGLCSAR